MHIFRQIEGGPQVYYLTYCTTYTVNPGYHPMKSDLFCNKQQHNARWDCTREHLVHSPRQGRCNNHAWPCSINSLSQAHTGKCLKFPLPFIRFYILATEHPHVQWHTDRAGTLDSSHPIPLICSPNDDDHYLHPGLSWNGDLLALFHVTERQAERRASKYCRFLWFN